MIKKKIKTNNIEYQSNIQLYDCRGFGDINLDSDLQNRYNLPKDVHFMILRKADGSIVYEGIQPIDKDNWWLYIIK